MKEGSDSLPKASPVRKRSTALPLFTAHRMASGMPISEAHHFGDDHELERHRQAVGHRGEHGLAGAEGAAEVAVQHVPQPDAVALPDRQVEPHLGAQRRDLLGRRLVAQHRIGEIARQQRGDQEGEQRDGKQDRQQIKQPPSADEAEPGRT